MFKLQPNIRQPCAYAHLQSDIQYIGYINIVTLFKTQRKMNHLIKAYFRLLTPELPIDIFMQLCWT